MNTISDAKKDYDDRNVNDLFDLVQSLSKLELSERKNAKEFSTWVLKINSADTRDLVALISLLDTLKSSDTSRAVKALREGAIAQVAYKNATLISATMQKLDNTGTRLTIVSILLSIIGVLVAVLQIVMR